MSGAVPFQGRRSSPRPNPLPARGEREPSLGEAGEGRPTAASVGGP